MRKFVLQKEGVTLVELLIYAAIFTITAVFLVNILTAVTRVQVRQTSSNTVNQELSFVGTTIQRLVRQSSEIKNDPGVASTSLVLRITPSSTDPTVIYADASGTAIYLQQGSSTVPLTSDKVTVSSFSVTKYENPGGFAVVQLDVTLTYNSQTPAAQISRSWHGAISRISAATFDSDLIPNANNNYNLGTAVNTWKDAYFFGKVTVGTTTQHSKFTLTGDDLYISDTGKGPVVRTPNGSSCYRLGVDNSGNATTTSVSCP